MGEAEAKARWNLAVSGLPHATLDDIGGWPATCRWRATTPTVMLRWSNASPRITPCGPSQVVTATGCSMANFLALAALIEPGDEVLIERPTYDPLLLAAAHLGASIVRFDRRAEDGFRVDPDDVVGAHDAAYARHRAGQSAQPVEPADAERGAGADWRGGRPRRRARDRGRGLPGHRLRRRAGFVPFISARRLSRPAA